MAGGGRGRGRGQPIASTQAQRITRGNRISSGASGASGTTGTSGTTNPDCNCSFCSSVVGNNAIGCDQCNAWFHPKTQCTGLSVRAIECIQAEGGAGIRFICSACRCISANATQSGSLPDQETISQLHLIVKSLAESVAKLTTKVNMIINNENSSSRNQQNQNFSRESLYTEMREFDEKKKRRESLIIRGLRGASDEEFSQTFISLSQTLINFDVTPDKIYCINRESGMFRVSISDSNVRRDILSNSKRLKDTSEFSQIYIARDLTYVQRQEMRARRLERLQGEGSDPVGNSTSHYPRTVVTGANVAPVASSNL